MPASNGPRNPVHRATSVARRLARSTAKHLGKVCNLALTKSYRIAKNKVFGRLGRVTQGKGDGTTSHVERYNAKIRMGNKRYVRKTNAYSKTFRQHVALVHLQTVYNNFCWTHTTLQVTPAMEAGTEAGHQVQAAQETILKCKFQRIRRTFRENKTGSNVRKPLRLRRLSGAMSRTTRDSSYM